MTITPLTEDNYTSMALGFRDRQAGVSLIYDPETMGYTYNAYCIETKLFKELFTAEYTFLADALNMINGEFGTWELVRLDGKKNCTSCVAK